MLFFIPTLTLTLHLTQLLKCDRGDRHVTTDKTSLDTTAKGTADGILISDHYNFCDDND